LTKGGCAWVKKNLKGRREMPSSPEKIGIHSFNKEGENGPTGEGNRSPENRIKTGET